ncbi:phosphogluconate dehydrogenase (NAD(+)-dependent, decarboxylating) [uncultured Anaerococcus sp.]|uniref:phosphogluconate dehydrogenase (NAD(+)-dependent, decarboxylating) n=1 Tax=uncultured Anaerococcus sp. TaxID=293428 RepID=UPI0025CC3BB2|nr:decarboxylating 6-phosphogluconate dehydrogenase [uncultured Anaerococcus sp.]
MQTIGLVGLGKMGYNIALNMNDNWIDVIGYDVNSDVVDKINSEKLDHINAVDSLEKLVNKLPEKKVIWVMVPAGEITDETIHKLKALLSEGDIIIDGGNSNYKDSLRRYKDLKESKIGFLDCGTSGGQEGARYGINAMIGGDADDFSYVEEIFQKISQEGGYLYTGEAGSGHYLKMVHNGIEYGMMAAIGEGFDLLENSGFEYDYEKVCQLWNNGSVIRSWLIELAGNAFSKDSKLDGIEGVMYSSGEGKWMVEESVEKELAIPVITMSLLMRYRSMENDTFTGKVVAALRNEFGGHSMKEKNN